VPKNYLNKTEGICGNNDDDKKNDYRTRQGVLTKSASKIGDSWPADNMM